MEQTFIEKWKAGINKVTQLQQLLIQQRSNWIMLLGLVCGMVVMAFNLKQWWWIEIILGAGVVNQLVVILGTGQKINAIRKIDELLKEVNIQEENNGINGI